MHRLQQWNVFSCSSCLFHQLPSCSRGFVSKKKEGKYYSHLSCAAERPFLTFLQFFSLSSHHNPLQECTGQSHQRNTREELQWPVTSCKEKENHAGRVVQTKAGLWEMKVGVKGQAWIAMKLIPNFSHASSICFQFDSLMFLVQFSPCSPSSASPFKWQ